MRALVLILTLALGACAGYQVGDQSARVGAVKADYCQATTPATRQAALAVIHAWVPGYPPSSICSPGFVADVIRALAPPRAPPPPRDGS